MVVFLAVTVNDLADKGDYEVKMDSEDRIRGKRAEHVALWYLRLNGFFLIPNFLVHGDLEGQGPYAEADALGLRLKNSFEAVRSQKGGPEGRNRETGKPRKMVDDKRLTDLATVKGVKRHLGIIVEVKAGICAINGPWKPDTSYEKMAYWDGRTPMERSISRMGIFDHSTIRSVVDEVSDPGKGHRYVSSDWVIQYVSIGSVRDGNIRSHQITFDEISEFLAERFNLFPGKAGLKEMTQWENFGLYFRDKFADAKQKAAGKGGKMVLPEQVKRLVNDYLKSPKSDY